MLVQVTQEDIGSGVPEDCLLCPIAVALNRQGLTAVAVYNMRAYFNGCGWVELPPKAVDFIDSFDKRQSVQPFEFDLPLPLEQKAQE